MKYETYADKPIVRLDFDSAYIPEPNSGCWLWVRNYGGGRYGRLTIDGEEVGAHRFSYERAHGPIPEGSHVLHRCDTPICVNPDHLFLGTHAGNLQDAANKGRVGGQKLSTKDVLAIRADKRTGQAVADDYGVSETLVRLIRHRKRWAWL
jgi:hypothetical protein